jgi:hypothetical protein
MAALGSDDVPIEGDADEAQLTGYLYRVVYEELLFMLLDSLEAIDAERMATLGEYLNDYAGYLLVTLLPEDATVLPDEYQRITEI